MENENVWKNKEGYSDPTAGAVLIKEIEPRQWQGSRVVYTTGGDKLDPGDIVECPIVSRFEDAWMLVLASHPDATICLELKEIMSDGQALKEQCWIVPEFDAAKEKHRDYFVDTRRLRAYGTHTFGKKLAHVDGSTEVLGKVLRQLGLTTDPTPEEAEPEWILEEAPDLDLLLHKQRADIYEKAFYALLERK